MFKADAYGAIFPATRPLDLSQMRGDCSRYCFNLSQQNKAKLQISCKPRPGHPQHCFKLGNNADASVAFINCALFEANSVRLCFELSVNATKSPQPSATPRRSADRRTRITKAYSSIAGRHRPNPTRIEISDKAGARGETRTRTTCVGGF